MQHVYNGHLPPSTIAQCSARHLLALISAARLYELRSLSRQLNTAIARRLDADNVVDVYDYARVRK